MDTEFEAKFYPINKSSLRSKLRAVDAILITPERKLRRVIFNRRFNSQIKCDYIRVRDEGDVIRLSAKTNASSAGQLVDQKETDVTVNDFGKTIEILQLAGISPDFDQENLRETWHLKDTEITIDTWSGLEPCIEIEANSEDKVKHAADLLDFKWDHKIITSYVEIFMAVYHLSQDEVLRRIAHINLASNPFAGLPAFPVI